MLKELFEHRRGGRSWALDIASFVNEGLGHSSYLVDLGDGTALVVDPARIPTAQLSYAAERGLRSRTRPTPTPTPTTSRAAPTSPREGATFLAPAAAGLDRDYQGLGRRRHRSRSAATGCEAIATPGHTPDHLAYLLSDDDGPVALFSGGSLMVGHGRPHRPARRRAPRGPRPRPLPGACATGSSPSPTTCPCTRPTGRGRSARRPAAGTAPPPSAASAPPTRCCPWTRTTSSHTCWPASGRSPTTSGGSPRSTSTASRLHDDVPALAPLDLDDGRPPPRPTGRWSSMPARSSTSPPGTSPGRCRSSCARCSPRWLGWLTEPRPAASCSSSTTTRTKPTSSARPSPSATTTSPASSTAASTPGPPPDGRSRRSSWSTADAIDGHDARHPPGQRVRRRPRPRRGPRRARRLGPTRAPSRRAGHASMCGHGERAMTGASILEAAGHPDVAVLAGGPADWAAATGTRRRRPHRARPPPTPAGSQADPARAAGEPRPVPAARRGQRARRRDDRPGAHRPAAAGRAGVRAHRLHRHAHLHRRVRGREGGHQLLRRHPVGPLRPQARPRRRLAHRASPCPCC